MRSGLVGQRLVVVFLAGMLLINYPLLALFDHPDIGLAGIPVLYLYVFGVWLGAVLVMAWISERDYRQGGK
ncbi:MAG: hypothetical protein RBS40_14790 [Rhodocyclaceae bacterium]|jgi:hypothetical protein|nr:hypothetical protein [Rhodocyclaceae bacterium]